MPFDVCGPLPEGVTVLEASAGTGKTFTIAALAARYVAERGVPLDRLLVVTFTRMATSELRNRVRERLVSAERGLAWALAGVAPGPDDDVLCLLADAPPVEVGRRRARLARALSDYDAATITTIHGFCQAALDGFGLAGDMEAGVTFTEDVGDLVEEVIDDLYVRKFHQTGAAAFNREVAGRIGRLAVTNPGAVIEPSAAPAGSEAALRAGLARAVRTEVDRRKRTRRLLTYDDQLTRLRDSLADPATGAAAAARMQERWSVALVDEFQDTDPIQWEVMRRAFGAGGSTLVLIGDPKQAVYAFRGADVYAYLEAARTGSPATLDVNWRSDQGLIDAYDALFLGAKLGHEGIVYRPVRAALAHQAPRLVGTPVSAPLRVRVLHREDGLVPLTARGWVSTPAARLHIAADLAADVSALLASSASIEARSRNGAATGEQSVQPGDIAVLVRRNRDATTIRNALESAGIPAVINGAGSVFDTPIARDWLRLMEALERPTSTARAHSAALTAFFGWTVADLAAAGDTDLEGVHVRLHRWAAVLRRRGVASLLESITTGEGLPARMLGYTGGERALTDLRHVGQLLHAEASAGGLGAAALTGWLRQRIAEAGEDNNREDRSRRLESDAEAVQVLTIHRAKGLEFGVVYCPSLWEPGYLGKSPMPFFHDPDRGGRRTIDVGGDSHTRYQLNCDHYTAEQRGEDLRLAYVALTRARHQAVLWWAGGYEAVESFLGRLLFARDAEGNVALRANPAPSDAAVEARLTELAGDAPGLVSVERSGAAPGRGWAPPAPALVDLSAAPFGRRLDFSWRRTSYSAITAAAHEERVASEPEEAVVVDEPGVVVVGPAAAPGDGHLSAAVVLDGGPAGADFGTFVHGVLEHCDFAAGDLTGEVALRVAEQSERLPFDMGDPGRLASGLAAAIETPLGPLLGEARLRDIGWHDRLNELHFELPLVGGDTPAATLTVAAIADAFAAHLPAGDPLAAYPARLASQVPSADLRGYLSGSLDLVVRVSGAFAVMDHKTNRLAPAGEALTAWHFRPEALAEAMMRAHYPLQALLYLVALHRYLRWRLAGYNPATHLAGALYLFVRGMTGPDTPRVDGRPCGVFAWPAPTALVVATSDLLDQGVA